MPTGSIRRWMLGTVLLLGALALGTWALVDRALGGIAPYSVVRDAVQRRQPALGAAFGLLRPRPPALDLQGLPGLRAPAPASPSASGPTGAADGLRRVQDLAGLQQALAQAQPGDTIELAAGDYRLASALRPARGGWTDRPITLRALPGARLLQGGAAALKLNQPWWVVDGLQIEGQCQRATACEAGVLLEDEAHHVRLSRLQVRDVNTAVKVRGEGRFWPDEGALTDSLIELRQPRHGRASGQALDLQGASGWRVAGNRILGVGRPNAGSAGYAIALRGGGEHTDIERNLIVCAPVPEMAARSGPQVAIAVGDGAGSEGPHRGEDRGVAYSHLRVQHNVVMNCSDAAVDLRASRDVLLAHNTLLSSGGVMLRGAGTVGEMRANLTSGAWYPRRGALLTGSANRRWVPSGTDAAAALREARALPPAAGASAPPGADTRWLLP